jgi:hypothetical protein
MMDLPQATLFNRRLGEQDLAKLAADHLVLQLLDSGTVNQARALLILREDGQILGLNAVSPYLPDPSCSEHMPDAACGGDP